MSECDAFKHGTPYAKLRADVNLLAWLLAEEKHYATRPAPTYVASNDVVKRSKKSTLD